MINTKGLFNANPLFFEYINKYLKLNGKSF